MRDLIRYRPAKTDDLVSSGDRLCPCFALHDRQLDNRAVYRLEHPVRGVNERRWDHRVHFKVDAASIADAAVKLALS